MNFFLPFVFIASFFFLVRSGALLVSTLTGLARFFGLSEYVVAFILMGFATSISELFVGISSAVSGVPGLSLGNVLGANLLNITVVIGAAAFLGGGIEVESKISRQNFWLIFILSLFPFLLGFDGVISRADGVILIVSFFIYIWHIIGEREYFTKILNKSPFGLAGLKTAFHDLFWFAAGATILLLSSWALVWSGKQIAEGISFGLFSFGVVFVALGTTLPEIVFGIRSVLRRHGSLAIGNSLGSVAFNAAFIVGLVSIIQPIIITNLEQFFFVIGAFVVAFIFFNLFVYRGSDISRKEGVVLIAVYLIFFILELFFSK